MVAPLSRSTSLIAPYTSQQPVDDYGLTFANLKYSANIAASTDTVLVIPGNARRYKALIKWDLSNAPAWVALNEVAESPVGASFALTSSEILTVLGICREVKAGDELHFFSNTDSSVSVVLYALNTDN